MNPNDLGDFGLAWLEASGPHADVVLSTRIRLARNLQGHTFCPRMTTSVVASWPASRQRPGRDPS
jgi:protein-arginine kinase